MREIEFRGKDVVTGEWRYGYVVICDNRSYILKDIGGISYEVIPETVGQYIGKKDKNGVKIFTGDIIKFSGGGVWSVYYCEDTSMFRLRNGGLTCCVADGKLYSVIGNTTDNPELLETAHA